MPRIRKNKRVPCLPPEQVEAMGRLSPAELAACAPQLRLPPFGSEAAAYGAARARTQEDTRCAVGDPPLLIGGETSARAQPGKPGDTLGYEDSIVLDKKGNPIVKPGVRVIQGQKVGIDWASCVFETQELWVYSFVGELSEAEEAHQSESVRLARSVRKIFCWILGFDQTELEARFKEYPNGLNGYSYAVGLPLSAGVVHSGHSSGTVHVTVTGQGAAVAGPGWEYRLHKFLKLVRGWLTRVDMAFDDYEGQFFPVRRMREVANEGGFKRDKGGRCPKIEVRGAWDQDDPQQSGLTLYIGSRVSGKLCRIYEKGRQLGDVASEWVRCEVELHNSCYQLNLDMLIKPTQWFVAFYPPLEAIQYAGNRTELEYRKRVAGSTIEQSKKWLRHQAGGHLAALRELYDDGELLDMLVRPDAIPQAYESANAGLAKVLDPPKNRDGEQVFERIN